MHTQILLFISIFIISILLFFFTFKKKSKLPPGPRKLPFIGNLHQLGKLPHRSLHNLSKKHGELMFLQLGSVPTLVVSSADMVREIIKNHDIIFSGRPALHAVEKFTYNFSGITFSTYGQYWRNIRKTVFLELMTAKRVRSFENVRMQEVDMMIDKIARSSITPIDLSEITFTLSNTIVTRVAFGTINSSVCNRDFQEIFRDVQHYAAEINVADYFPWMSWINKFSGYEQRMARLFRELDIVMDEVLEDHLDTGGSKLEGDDIAHVLLRNQKDPNQNFALTNEQIKAVLTGLSHTYFKIQPKITTVDCGQSIRNPIVMRKAQQELREIAKGQPSILEADIPKLTYLKLVIKESLRLHPAAPLMVPRETIEKCTLDNKYEIPAKTRVYLNATAIHADPKYWEEPDKFFPERFMNTEIDYRGQDFEFLPFGAGRRGCPGINFAIPLVELALANLLLVFDWNLPKGMEPKDVDMEEALGITMHKKIPLCLVATKAYYGA